MNGVPKTGAACTKDGAAMCESCKHGYYINTDQTKCSGVCVFDYCTDSDPTNSDQLSDHVSDYLTDPNPPPSTLIYI